MPQLNALRAFEAAARMNSIAAAADELCVTPAAVAQQVKSLEAWAGKELFKRYPQGVKLTPLGASVLGDFTAAFDGLGQAVQKLRTNAAPLQVRIAALPSIAQLFVSPRLPKIRLALPEVSISVSALEQPPNLIREPFDLAIFYEEVDADTDKSNIWRDWIFPVCSPAVAERLKTVGDLESEVFLHDSSWKDDWKTWLAEASPKQNLNKSGPEFSLYSLALEECKNGAGVLIGHEALVRPQIETGQLVAPFAKRVSLARNIAFSAVQPLDANTAFGRVATMLMQGDE
jgi:LysR family glycine cleavage system transcriptional activator